MQKYTIKNIQKYALTTSIDLMKKYAKIYKKYARNICKICRNEIYMQNIQKSALPTFLIKSVCHILRFKWLEFLYLCDDGERTWRPQIECGRKIKFTFPTGSFSFTYSFLDFSRCAVLPSWALLLLLNLKTTTLNDSCLFLMCCPPRLNISVRL